LRVKAYTSITNMLMSTVNRQSNCDRYYSMVNVTFNTAAFETDEELLEMAHYKPHIYNIC
jgi:hypothetical protein